MDEGTLPFVIFIHDEYFQHYEVVVSHFGIVKWSMYWFIDYEHLPILGTRWEFLQVYEVLSKSTYGGEGLKATHVEEWLLFVLKVLPLICMLSIPEKSRIVKQKHSRDGKRGDKRNLKAPMKVKFESFFPEAGLLSSNSAAGGNNILGIYGLKSGIHDVIKHVDELSLNELLDDSYKCPTLCQDKGKKATNVNENILHSVRKACSVLQLWRPVQSRNAVDLDSSSNRKTPSCLLSSASSVISSIDCDKGDNCTTDLTSCRKDSCSKPKAPVNTNDSLLLQPKDILERLALLPAKDLDSLLLDTAKPSLSSRSITDLRSGKPLSQGASLPPFHWSHSSGGACKSNVDSGKLSTNRGICQGKWVRIGSIASSLGGAPSCFSDLDSLTFDHSLVPSGGIKMSLSGNEKAPCTPVRLPGSEQASSSIVSHLASHVPPGKTILKGSGALGSHKSLDLKFSQRCLESSDAHMKFSFSRGNFLKLPETDLKYQGNGTILMAPSANNLPFQVNGDNYIGNEQSKRRNPGGCTDSSCYSPSNCAVGGYDQLLWQENSKQAGHSPRLLAAAQTLYEIASHSTKQNQSSGMIRWPKKPSQKAMKARKSRSSTGKAESISITTKSVMGPGDPIKIAEHIIPSKRPKVLTTDKKKDIDYTNNVERGPMKWSTPTSSRSSPSKLDRDSVSDMKQSNASIVKLLGIMPSTTRLLDKACNSQQKPRKPVPMDWGRRSKKE
ncbi:hypothetical protein HHK36_029045 [Tetracentron sinense]|uniref:Uncharacterized protein n=1 Tax=Tetracentron sinense TaxID=13715 RepID=A0A834YED6_TETSI|nr:hypothetical protein HHK36_029045 [Tetracentron sinense]